MCKCTYGNTITRTNNFENSFLWLFWNNNHNPAGISLKAFCNRQPIVEYHQGIPTRVPCDGLSQWYSTTGASQIVTPDEVIPFIIQMYTPKSTNHKQHIITCILRCLLHEVSAHSVVPTILVLLQLLQFISYHYMGAAGWSWFTFLLANLTPSKSFATVT